MKINKKVIALLEEGFSIETLRGMSDNNISYLYSKLLSEQVATTKGTIVTKKEPKAIELANKGYNVRLEKKEMGEAKKSKTNPWAICTAQLKKEFGTSERSEWTKSQMKKYEKCVMDVKGQSKKDMKESNIIDSFIEDQMNKMVESTLRPQVTKRDLLKHLKEQAAPTTKPTIKPATPKIKPSREDNPFQNPRPGVKTPAKADTTTKPTTKPATPKTKPTREDNPFQNPRPGVKTPPKADTTTKPTTKPATPKTKPTREDNPFQNPRPGVKTPPKAISPEKAKGAIINNIMQLINFKG